MAPVTLAVMQLDTELVAPGGVAQGNGDRAGDVARRGVDMRSDRRCRQVPDLERVAEHVCR